MPPAPMAAQARTIGVPATAFAPRTARAGNGPDDAPHEVHIHIGRIEVTAVAEPPAKRPKPKAAPPLQSLDAYLAARGRT